MAYYEKIEKIILNSKLEQWKDSIIESVILTNDRRTFIPQRKIKLYLNDVNLRIENNGIKYESYRRIAEFNNRALNNILKDDGDNNLNPVNSFTIYYGSTSIYHLHMIKGTTDKYSKLYFPTTSNHLDYKIANIFNNNLIEEYEI